MEAERVGAVAVLIDVDAVMLRVMYLCLTLLATRILGVRNHHHQKLQEVNHDLMMFDYKTPPSPPQGGDWIDTSNLMRLSNARQPLLFKIRSDKPS